MSPTQLLFNTETEDARVKLFLSPFTHCLFFTNENSPILINARKQHHLNVLYQVPFPSENVPIIDYHLSLFKSDSLDSSSACTSLIRLLDQPSDQQTTESAATTVVALAPGSGSRRKNWPLHYYQKVENYLTERGFDVYWIAGECERDYQFRNTDKIVRDLDLIALSRFLFKCTLYIGNDSGITHLAAASHCPVIAIFGASNPWIWAPRGPAGVKCIFKSTCINYCQTYRKVFNCNQECLKSVRAEDVIAEIDFFLSRLVVNK
jgi:ADP-heptose:LPS heptosyltransferase